MSASRLAAILTTALATVTCDLLTSPKTKSNILIDYPGVTRLVVGTPVPFTLAVTDNNAPLDRARLSVVTSDSNVVAVRDEDGGFSFTLLPRKRGRALVRAELVSSTLTDDPPFEEVTFTAVAATLAIDSASVSFESLKDTLTSPLTILDGNGDAIAGAAAATRWVSLDPTVASVDSISGKLKALRNGATKIVATIDSIVTDTADVTVRQRLTRYTFAPGSLVFDALSRDTLLVVTPRDSGGSPIDSGVTLPTPVFTSLNAGVVSVSAAGLITSTGNGSAGVRVQGPGTAADDTLPVTVNQVASRVEIAGAGADTLNALQDTLLLQAVATDPQGVEVRGRSVTWFSRQSTVVQVSPASGWIRGVALGETRIVAQLDAATDSVTVLVRDVAQSLVTTASLLLTAVGDSAVLTGTALNRLGAPVPGVAVAWRALDPAIASVGEANGIVVGRSIGNTIVVGTIAGGYTDTTLVSVEDRVASLDIVTRDTIMASAADTFRVHTHIFNARGDSLGLSSVNWSLSDSTVLSVASALVTALKAGSSYVYAVDRLNPGRRDSVLVRVTNAPLSLQLNRWRDTLTAPTLTLKYDVVARNRRTDLIVNPAVAWRSDTVSVASVSATGLATAVKAGTTLIIVEASGDSGLIADTAILVVRNDAVSLTVSPTDVTIPGVGVTVALSADARNSVGGTVTGVTFDWSSSADSIATVSSSGDVTGIKPGTATVTVRLAALSASAKVTVTNAPARIEIDSTTVTLASVNDVLDDPLVDLGARLYNVQGAALPSSAAQWSSDDPVIAQVTADGWITALSRGTTKVRARSALNVAIQDSVVVIVSNAPETVEVTPAAYDFTAVHRTAEFSAVVKNRRADVIAWPVTWSPASTPAGVVSITSTGPQTALVRAEAVGTGATFSATTDNGKIGSATVNVSNNAVSIVVAPARDTIFSPTLTASLTATALNDLGEQVQGIAWESKNTSVAACTPSPCSLDATVNVLAVAPGVAEFVASVNPGAFTKTASAYVTVVDAPTFIGIGGPAIVLHNVGATSTLTDTITGRGGNDLGPTAANWTSSAPTVATVSATAGGAVVTAVGVGTATITATSPYDPSLSSSRSVEVVDDPASLTVDPATYTFTAVGRSREFAAVVRNSRNQVITGHVTWSSSPANIVAIDTTTTGPQAALVTATNVGSATLTATTDNGIPGSATVTVTNAPASVTLAPAALALTYTEQQAVFTATARNDLGIAVGDRVRWSSSNRAVVDTVSRPMPDSMSMTIKSDTIGTATITVTTSNGLTTSAPVTVTNEFVVLAIDTARLCFYFPPKSTVTLPLTFQNGATPPGTIPPNVADWSTSDRNVATISATKDNAKVTSQGLGTATITAVSPTNAGMSDFVDVIVTKADSVDSVKVTPADTAVTTEVVAVQFSDSAFDACGTRIAGASITWTSTNTAVATVNGSGLATITGAGTAYLKATSGAGADSALLTVTSVPHTVTVSPATATLTAVDATQPFTAVVTDRFGATVAGVTLTWSSDAPTIASVDNPAVGVAKAVSSGTAIIKAAVAGAETINGTATLTVAIP